MQKHNHCKIIKIGDEINYSRATKIPLKNQPLRAGFFMPAIKKLADARDVILHELILHELIGHLSCAVVTVKSVQANNVNHVCTKTEKAHLHPMLEEMFAVAGK